MLTDFTRRFRLLWWAASSIVLSALSLVLFVVTLAGTVLMMVWIGVPIVIASTALTRRLAEYRRPRVAALVGEPLESPYLQRTPGGPLVRVVGLAKDPAVRRDAAWLAIDGTLGLALSIIGTVEGVFDVLFWWLPPGLAVRLHAHLDHTLLAKSEKSRLALRVQSLTESRAETVDTQAAEIRRIERDLHDGAQARLVAIGMSLGMAEEELARDPETARALLVEARGTAGDALAELRTLVRGIHPPVLADRGLVEAVHALAQAVAMPVLVRAEIPGRLPAPVESAAYFAIAEGITNAIKHARASKVSVVLEHEHGVLTMCVADDGVGGADVANGSGLRGIARRLAAFDGGLDVSSPVGGPTTVTMVLPCVSSSPKTSPSSGTA